MAMHQVVHCIYEALNERSDCYQQSRKKEHRMHRNAEANCKSR